MEVESNERLPAVGSPAELKRFAELQTRLRPLFERVFPNRLEPRTVVVVPALSLDADVLANIAGLQHYEERMLCMLMLLRLPRTRVIYITSVPVDPSIVDYYLHLLPGVPGVHARRRLSMFCCHDASVRTTVTQKVLARPRLLERVRRAIRDPASAHMTCFNATEQERSLAVRLGIPLFACDPALSHLGSKSGSRKIFKEAGVPLPDGYEALRDEEDLVEALARLKATDAGLRRAAVKLEEGTSGTGNATFDFQGCPERHPQAWIRSELPTRLKFEDPCTDWEAYREKFAQMGGIVEAWIEGQEKCSPSVQCRINPLGETEMISTHDQVLGGPSGQIFLGCTFPAREAYRLQIQEIGLRVAEVLRERSVLGRFGVDFVSVKRGEDWKHYAIEINLRKGGTTHTLGILQFLTEGSYDTRTGLFMIPSGTPRFYKASDNLKNPDYQRLTPDDLVNIAVEKGLHFRETTQKGVFFHLIGALSGYGKLGLVCVADTPEGADALYRETVETLDREALSS